MKLYPQDLRDRQHAVIIRRRAYGVYSGAAPTQYSVLSTEPPAPRLGRLGRLWMRGTGLTEQEAATSLPAASVQTGPALWFLPLLAVPAFMWAAFLSATGNVLPGWETWGVTAAGTGATLWLSLTQLPRSVLRGLHKKPLSTSEIDALLPDAHTDVDRAYLGLLRDAVQQTVPPDAEIPLRDALRSLARAVDSLPPLASAPQDTNALRQQAQEMSARAGQEKNGVVAASMERQADALSRRAAALERSAQVVGRTPALRSELLAQMEALRAGLTDFRTDGASDAGMLAALSEDARRVANEAGNVALARAELDTFLAPPMSSENTVLRAGRE